MLLCNKPKTKYKGKIDHSMAGIFFLERAHYLFYVKVFDYLTFLKSCYIEYFIAQIYLCIRYPENFRASGFFVIELLLLAWCKMSV